MDLERNITQMEISSVHGNFRWAVQPRCAVSSLFWGNIAVGTRVSKKKLDTWYHFPAKNHNSKLSSLNWGKFTELYFPSGSSKTSLGKGCKLQWGKCKS